jgi:hypothetical protein
VSPDTLATVTIRWEVTLTYQVAAKDARDARLKALDEWREAVAPYDDLDALGFAPDECGEHIIPRWDPAGLEVEHPEGGWPIAEVES